MTSDEHPGRTELVPKAPPFWVPTLFLLMLVAVTIYGKLKAVVSRGR